MDDGVVDVPETPIAKLLEHAPSKHIRAPNSVKWSSFECVTLTIKLSIVFCTKFASMYTDQNYSQSDSHIMHYRPQTVCTICPPSTFVPQIRVRPKIPRQLSPLLLWYISTRTSTYRTCMSSYVEEILETYLRSWFHITR